MAVNERAGSRKPPRPPRGPAAPLLQWAIDTEFRYLRDGDWLPLLVQFRAARQGKGGALQRFTTLDWLSAEFKGAVRVPQLVRRTVERNAAISASKSFHSCVLWIQRDRMAAIARDAGWRATIVRAEPGPPIEMVTDASADSTVANSTTTAVAPAAQSAAVNRQRVVIGVIDQGIAFAHERFRNSAGTRIESLLLQDVGGGAGVELTRAQINAAITQAAAKGLGDEGAYRSLGLLDFTSPGYKPLAMRRAHGTHVLDLAAGAPVSDEVTDRPIIAVEMPEDAVGDPVGSTLNAHAWLGILHILDRAETLRAKNETLPIVVNLSYGPHTGPHDGSTVFEQYVDTLQQTLEGTKTPMRFVFAAGNFRQARVHASATIGARSRIEWKFRVQPEDKTPSFVELWFDSNKAAVDLVPPAGRTLKVSLAKPLDKEPPVGPGGTYSAEFVDAIAPSSRSLVSFSLAPTATDPPLAANQPTVPAGPWKIVIRNRTKATPIKFDGWIRRDETLAGRRSRGRQSRFEDSVSHSTEPGRPVEFGTPTLTEFVDRRCTLNGIATGKFPLVVGGYRVGLLGSEMFPASYSSAGPHLNPARATGAPTFSFPSDDTRACRGRLGAGVQSGSTVAMNGTSVAAPQATRWLADQYALNGAFPAPPFKNPPVAQLRQPIVDPQRPIPAADLPLTAGDGLMLAPASRGRPSRTAPL